MCDVCVCVCGGVGSVKALIIPGGAQSFCAGCSSFPPHRHGLCEHSSSNMSLPCLRSAQQPCPCSGHHLSSLRLSQPHSSPALHLSLSLPCFPTPTPGSHFCLCQALGLHLELSMALCPSSSFRTVFCFPKRSQFKKKKLL